MDDEHLRKIEQYLDNFFDEDGSISEETSSNSSPEEQLREYRQFLVESLDEFFYKKQKSRIWHLINRIDEVWKECDFFDPEGELDMMFPERHDEEHDDDEDENMSTSAFFGE